MQLSEILSNEELRRQEFPVCRDLVFLAHAGDCPLPRRVAEAVSAYAAQCTAGDQEKFVFPAVLDRGRELAARLLNARPEEIAFVGPTSLALSFIAGSLPFRRGDNVLVYQDDYPSNVYPWMALAERGVEVRYLNTRGLGVIRPRDVLGQLDEQTRLVALATCHFISGYRIDHQAIGAALKKRNILLCLDAIQTLGAFPTTVEHADLLAADAHKWLLGPCAAGLMYVRQPVLERMSPRVFGWGNVRCPNYVTQEEIVFRKDSLRFEVGTHNFLGLVGLVAALELILELGVEAIAAELLRKRAWLVPALQAKGYTVVGGPAEAPTASGIVSLFRPLTDMPGLHQRLSDAGIVTSLRTDRAGQRYIRLSPHFYNTDAELQRVMELL